MRERECIGLDMLTLDVSYDIASGCKAKTPHDSTGGSSTLDSHFYYPEALKNMG